MNKGVWLSLSLLILSGCQSQPRHDHLYQRLGGEQGLIKITEHFVRLLVRDPRTAPHFEETNLERFYEKLFEQLCEVSGGPCSYTGDSMEEVHKGMNITESDFNATVEVLQKAMDDNHVPLSTQNQLLARLAALRGTMLYR